MNRISTNQKIAVIGEILFDCYQNGESTIGGAPFNFAMNLSYLGYKNISIYSTIAKNFLGEKVIENCKNLDTTNIKITDGETPKVIVSCDKNKDNVFNIPQKALFDEIDFSPKNSIVYFGSLAMRYNHNLEMLQKTLDNNNVYICDINLRNPFYNFDTITKLLQITDILKVNSYELEILSNFLLLKSSVKQTIEILQNDFKIPLILVTDGDNGGKIYFKENIFNYTAIKVDAISTVGAGDAFFAGFIWGLTSKLPIEDSIKIATEISSKVCGSLLSYLKK